nr:lytic transglycosylase domain-containing protein [Burkholderia metallica]
MFNRLAHKNADRFYLRVSRPIGRPIAVCPRARRLTRSYEETNSTFVWSPFRYEPQSLAPRLPLLSLSASTAGGLVAYRVDQVRYTFYTMRRRTPCVLRKFGVAAAATFALLATSPAAADVCKGNIFNDAAALYHLDPDLLRAITWVESRGVPSAVGPRLSDGHRAWGAAQINDVHLPELVSYGVTQRDLLNPCVNLKLSAWVLANCIQSKGAIWAAVGCYNTGPGSTNAAAQARYVRLVQRAYAGYRAQSTLGNATERGPR